MTGGETMGDLHFQRGDRVRFIDMSDAPFPAIVGLIGVIVSIVSGSPVQLALSTEFLNQHVNRDVYYVRIGDQVFAMHETEIEFE